MADTIGCPECGSIGGRAMAAAESALAVGETAAVGWQCERDARAAAEARVEELSEALQALVDAVQRQSGGMTNLVVRSMDAARAALAGREERQ